MAAMEDNKLPLKRVELSLSKFNEVAIPHHLDLLRQHKANIFKYEEAGDYPRVRTEQTHARRVAAQLRALLAEVDALRRQLRPDDCPKFDALTRRSRELTLKAIMEYLGPPAAPAPQPAASVTSTDSVGTLPLLQVQLEVDQQELELRAREEALRGWSELQDEVRELHAAWSTLHVASLAQREQVSSVSEHVAVTDDNVVAARADLSYAERCRVGLYGVAGAALGAAAGGPLGLALGAKAAALAALSGSLAGYLGGKIIGQRRQLQIEQETETQQTHTDNTDTHIQKKKDE